MILFLYLLVGAVAGLTAGLFGVGGGLVIVPVLVFCFSALGFPEVILTQMAVGTSLATIVITSISSVRAHHKLGNVDWLSWRPLSVGIVLGVWLGAMSASQLPGVQLQLIFGVFALWVAAQMGLGLKPKPGRDLPGTAGLSGVGVVVGYVSALFGIGGGSLTVPFLSWCNVRMQQVVATSAACGLPIAVVGAIAYVWQGSSLEGLPDYSSGYIYWPAFFGIVLTSSVFAKWGAALAQRLDANLLKRVFALYLLAVGLQFVWRSATALWF